MLPNLILQAGLDLRDKAGRVVAYSLGLDPEAAARHKADLQAVHPLEVNPEVAHKVDLGADLQVGADHQVGQEAGRHPRVGAGRPAHQKA